MVEAVAHVQAHPLGGEIADDGVELLDVLRGRSRRSATVVVLSSLTSSTSHGSSICRMRPASTIARYSSRRALPTACTYSSSVG